MMCTMERGMDSTRYVHTTAFAATKNLRPECLLVVRHGRNGIKSAELTETGCSSDEGLT